MLWIVSLVLVFSFITCGSHIYFGGFLNENSPFVSLLGDVVEHVS
jgi:hypothetical protein